MKLFPMPKQITICEGNSPAEILQNKQIVHNPALGKQAYILRIDGGGV